MFCSLGLFHSSVSYFSPAHRPHTWSNQNQKNKQTEGFRKKRLKIRMKFIWGENHHKACFSNLAISQEANLERNQISGVEIRIGIKGTAGGGLLRRGPTIRGGRRRTGGEAAIFFGGFSRRTGKNPIPEEAEEVADKGDPFKKPPADESPAKLGHGGGGVMG